MKRLLQVLAVWFVLAPCSARAQATFSETTLTKGQRVRVTVPSGLQVQGVVTDVMPTALSVDGRVFQPEPDLKVERLGDSIWNGVAVGAIIGGALGASMDRTGCFAPKTSGCVLKPALVFGGIGALIDRAIVGRRTVFLGKPSTSAAIVAYFTGSERALFVTFSF